LIGNANSLAMFAFAFIQPRHSSTESSRRPAAASASARATDDSEAAAPIQETVCRLVVLAVELLHLQGRQARPIEVHPLSQLCYCMRPRCCSSESTAVSLELRDKLAELVARGRCTEEEGALLSAIGKNHYQVVLSWLLALLNDGAQLGFIAREQLIGAQTSVEKMRQASADLMVYVTTLMPFPYVQLVTFIVKFQVFLTFTDLACESDAFPSICASAVLVLSFMTVH